MAGPNQTSLPGVDSVAQTPPRRPPSLGKPLVAGLALEVNLSAYRALVVEIQYMNQLDITIYNDVRVMSHDDPLATCLLERIC